MTVPIDFRPLRDLLTAEMMDRLASYSELFGHTKGNEMAPTLGDPRLLTDSDVDALAWQFLNSAYADNNMYADWPLDRRLDGFLRREGLVRLVEDGDAYDLILNRVMTYIGVASHSGSE
jgi:hypothetical protein